jgi:hypothetical protein
VLVRLVNDALRRRLLLWQIFACVCDAASGSKATMSSGFAATTVSVVWSGSGAAGDALAVAEALALGLRLGEVAVSAEGAVEEVGTGRVVASGTGTHLTL